MAKTIDFQGLFGFVYVFLRLAFGVGHHLGAAGLTSKH
jgi:hypothetical protein